MELMGCWVLNNALVIKQDTKPEIRRGVETRDRCLAFVIHQHHDAEIRCR